VVTTAIRIVTDLFTIEGLRASINSGTIEESNKGQFRKIHSYPSDPPNIGNIGNVFKLIRFVLVSPDIHAETLVSNRANFLESSLRRFKEAYLFSNEGDEVLRLISTTMNYFSFPTKKRAHGYRLGNVEILSQTYGVVSNDVGHQTLTPELKQYVSSKLRVGFYTLEQLYQFLQEAERIAIVGRAKYKQGSYQDELPAVFTYFDCTDYVDSPRRPSFLTNALRRIFVYFNCADYADYSIGPGLLTHYAKKGITKRRA
jgi:hypothetical protein